jgi:hypothetical protein
MEPKYPLNVLDKQFSKIELIVSEIKSFLPLKTEDMEDINRIKTIDSFIYRFGKIQDIMGEKLFPAFLEQLQEYNKSMSLIDILHKLEKLNVLNTDDWIKIRQIRNTMTHEYPDNTDEIIATITSALEYFETMKNIYKLIANKLS